MSGKKGPSAVDRSKGAAKAKKEALARKNRGLSSTKKATKKAINASTHKMVNGKIVRTGSKVIVRKKTLTKKKVVIKGAKSARARSNSNGNARYNNNNNNNNNNIKPLTKNAQNAAAKALQKTGFKIPKGKKIEFKFVDERTKPSFTAKKAGSNGSRRTQPVKKGSKPKPKVAKAKGAARGNVKSRSGGKMTPRTQRSNSNAKNAKAKKNSKFSNNRQR